MTPHNLLLQPLPVSDLNAMFADCPSFPLMPPQGDSTWVKIAAKPLTKHWWPTLREIAKKEAGEPLPVLTAELYSDFTRTGNRLRFEEPYFERRRRLARAMTCALLEPGEGSWWESTLAKWREIFAEKSWALPAHVSDPSGQDPDTLDLFSTESMSLMCDLLSFFAKSTPPDLSDAIRKRVRKMQDIYLARAESISWTKITNNWNAVCHQGVLGSALAIEDDPQLLARLTALSAKYLRHFFEGFTADGGCTEGPSYWNYGFGFFCRLNEQLETRSHGCLSLLQGDPLIAKIAHYGRRMALEDDRFLNFSDCDQRGSPSAPLLVYLGRRLDQPENARQAETEFHHLLHATPNMSGGRSGVLWIMRHLLAAPETDRAPEVLRESFYYPDLSVWISRGVDSHGLRWTFAAKGGHNEEHHNHNDCASALLQVNQTVFLAEIGKPEYVKEFFRGGSRYQFLAARSYGHSLPVINGHEQHVGQQYAGKIIISKFGNDRDETTIEFGGSYPKEAGILSARRHITVQKKEFSATIRDEFSLDRADSLETALITYHEPKREGSAIILQGDGVRLRLEPNPETTQLRAKPAKVPAGLEAEHPDPAIEKLFYSNFAGKRDAVYRIVFEPIALAKECRMEVVLKAM